MTKKTLGILVGGGPAPGINGVISSATIEAINSGMDVLGIYDGFRWLIQEDTSKNIRLAIPDVSRIHLTGGSILRTSREGPLFDPDAMKSVITSLKKMGITHLLTIGGDGTCSSSAYLAKELKGSIKVVHAPKTIDNDLPLPEGVSTFGFETARHNGTYIVQNLMEDSKTTGRWYIVVTMGREAGYLALAISFAAGATVSIIPEEFKDGKIRLDHICDIIMGSIIKRRSMGNNHGVAVLAEGLGKRLGTSDFDAEKVEKDENSRLKLSDINIGKLVTDRIKMRFEDMGEKINIVHKFIGHELRSCVPAPFDIDYTRRIGYGAVRYMLGGGDGAMICFIGDKLHPLKFDEITDGNGFVRTRRVDIHSEHYKAVCSYMIKLKPDDFASEESLNKLAQTAGILPEQFEAKYSYLVKP